MSEQKKVIRKLQRSKTGYYVNLPINIVRQMNIDGNEVIKFTTQQETNKLIIEIIKV